MSIGLCLLLCAGELHAQKGDIAGAEALFQEGRRLMDEGDANAACPKLEESQRLDPGTGTLWHLARCYQDTGRLATAWATFHLVAQEAQRLGETAKVVAALAKAKKLKPKLHTLVIVVPEESQVDGLQITRGGAQVGSGAWDAPVPVDTGKLLVEAKAPGYHPWSETIKIGGKSKKQSVTVPPLEAMPEPEIKDDKPPPQGPRIKAEPWYRDKLGWAVFATGIVVAGSGGGSFLYSRGLADEAEASNDLGDRDRLFDKAHSVEVVGGVLLATGGVITVAGMVLLALTPSNGDTDEVSLDFSPSIRVDANSAYFGLSRHF